MEERERSRSRSWRRTADVGLLKIKVWTFKLASSDPSYCWIRLSTRLFLPYQPSPPMITSRASLPCSIGPSLPEASQDAAHDADTLQRHKVSHVLNVAYGVANLFPDQYVYKALPILDLPDTDITAYLGECSSFVDRAREKGGVVLVHCNAGVSRSTSIVIGYLMMREGLTFDEAYGQAKAARPSIRPNPGFHQQLRGYEP
uniref:Dual specificity phosphatase 19 n=1 Tax=Gasterosteus aculeatus aculeatus TaxID=481459 RepID=G3PCS2_GASAC